MLGHVVVVVFAGVLALSSVLQDSETSGVSAKLLKLFAGC